MGIDRRPVCLAIGGSDSSGGAGIQADLRVFEAFGAHGCSVITALTAQHPGAISRIEPVPLAQIEAELHALFDYYDIAVVKTGMLLDAERIALVSGVLSERHKGALVVDPVMVASSGRRLLHVAAVDTLVKALLPQATLVTPNLDEAAVFYGADVDDPVPAAAELAQRLGTAVLLKGGHREAEILADVLSERDGRTTEFTHCRQSWSLDERHGTGCRLASAVAAGLAQPMPLAQAVENAISHLQRPSL